MTYLYKKIKVNGKSIDEHRHIMQVFVGRKLNRNEHVHHKDGNKRNNNISNLEIVKNTDHSRLHALKGDYFGGLPKPWEFENRKHPSIQMYKEGCRCDGCREIQRLRMRSYRASKK